MPKRRSATRRTSQCFRSQPKRRGRTTLGRGNPGPNGIDASLSADWLNSPAASLKVRTSPSRASCAATNTSGRSLLAIRGRLSRSESGKSASTPSSNSTAPPSGNQPATATRRCPAKGHFLTRYRKVYPQGSEKTEFPDTTRSVRLSTARLPRVVGSTLPVAQSSLGCGLTSLVALKLAEQIQMPLCFAVLSHAAGEHPQLVVNCRRGGHQFDGSLQASQGALEVALLREHLC